MAMTIVEAARTVTGGIDTHGETHVAAALDEVGGLLATESFEANPDGYVALLSWLTGFGAVGKVGVEGTGAYGAGLARFLARAGVEVIEVDRPNRQERRRTGKSDPIDAVEAVEAARAALSGRANGHAKSRDGAVEAIRVLVVAKRSARQARVKALTQMRQLTFTAPDQLQCRIKGLPAPQFIAAAQSLRPTTRSADPVMVATKASLSSLAHRIGDLDEEIAALDARITPLLQDHVLADVLGPNPVISRQEGVAAARRGP
jgi:transposase